MIHTNIAINPDNINETPEQLVQRQLNAYNTGNIDGFLATYSDSIVLYNNFEVSITGKEAMRKRYQDYFRDNPKLHCEILNRMVQGNTVIDQERVTGRADGKVTETIAIYEVKDKLIHKVYFIKKD